MARFRVAPRARADLAHILATSEARWGTEAKDRYAAILSAAMLQVADEPAASMTRARRDLFSGLRSFHIRHTRRGKPERQVKGPVHILYYRVIEPGLIEIVRVLHERMEPSRHLGAGW